MKNSDLLNKISEKSSNVELLHFLLDKVKDPNMTSNTIKEELIFEIKKNVQGDN